MSAEEADSVDIVDVGSGEVVKSINVGERPRGIGFLPDGSRAYVAAENADTVAVIDVRTQSSSRKIKAGVRANGVTVHPDGKRVYVSAGGDGTVQVIEAARTRSWRRFLSASDPGTWRSRPTAASSMSRAGARTPWPSSIRESNRKIAEVAVGNCPGASPSADIGSDTHSS